MFGFRSKSAFVREMLYTNANMDRTVWEQGNDILKEAHILIAGSTGCGKSTLIHKLMHTALAYTPASKQFILIDMKAGMELGKYAHLPHVRGFARSYTDAVKLIGQAADLVASRCDTMYKQGKTLWDGADTYILIDELSFLLQCDEEHGFSALKKLVFISQQGRAAKVHLLLATQAPNRSRYGIPANLALNMTCKIGLHCMTAIESRQIIGLNGCENLPEHGTAFMVKGGKVWTLPISMVGEDTIQERINYWLDKSRCVIYK